MARIGINGFGRIGRLALRAVADWPELEVVCINEAAGDVQSAAHLLTFDSAQGTWNVPVSAAVDGLRVGDRLIEYQQSATIDVALWRDAGVDLVVDCTGAYRTPELLAPYLAAGVGRVVVSAPMPAPVPNVVFGVNQSIVGSQDRMVSGASCTTNCIAPVIDVVHWEFGIRSGSFTTIHSITNTQRVLDGFHKDWRRARAAGDSLIPTSTGSATAIGRIFPELEGRLQGLAVRVPTANASLADCAFDLERSVTAEQVNDALREAAGNRLAQILGVEDRPLVSIDYRGERRSAVVDALSTRVAGGTHLKLLAWYDNEMGYTQRMMELARWLLTRP